MWRELRECFSTLTNVFPDARAVVVSGVGRGFTAGLDLSDAALGASNGDPARAGFGFLDVVYSLQASLSAIETCRIPVIAAVHGPCIGAGIDLITACDVRYAAVNTVFSVKEVDVGLAADVGTLQRLPKVVGNSSWVHEICLTARNFTAAEALEHQLVSKVVDGSVEQVLEVAIKIASLIAEKSPVAVAGTKNVLKYSRDHSVEDGLKYVGVCVKELEVKYCDVLVLLREIMSVVFNPQTEHLTKRTGKDISPSKVGNVSGAGTDSVPVPSSARILSSSSLSLPQTIQTQLQSAQPTHLSSAVPPPTLEQLQRLAHSLKEKSMRNNSKSPSISTTAAFPHQPSTNTTNSNNNNAVNYAVGDVSDADAASYFNILFDPSVTSSSISSLEHSSVSEISGNIIDSCSPTSSITDLGSLTPADSAIFHAFELPYSESLNSNKASAAAPIDGMKIQKNLFSTLYMPPSINSADSPVAGNLSAVSSPDLFATFSSVSSTDWIGGSSLFLNDGVFEMLNIAQQIQADQMILDHLQPQDPVGVSMSQLNTFVAPTKEEMEDVAYFGLSDEVKFLHPFLEQEEEEKEEKERLQQSEAVESVSTESNIQESRKTPAGPPPPPPQKRPRGRPRKIQPPTETDKTPLTSSSTKKRKPSSPIRPKLSSSLAFIQSPTFAKQEDTEEFDEISYYIQLAEAATSGVGGIDSALNKNANIIKPLLARPLHPADAAKISLHSFRPSRPMDADLAREYLALKDPKLSAKERRQLRNKLSARSFRERRKEYIDTIEAELRAVVGEAVEARDALDGIVNERDMYRQMYEDLEARFASVKIEDGSLSKQLEESGSSGSGNTSKSGNSSNRKKYAGECRVNANFATTITTTSAVATTAAPNRTNLENNSIRVHSVSVPEVSEDVLQWLQVVSPSMSAPTPFDSMAMYAMKQYEPVLYKKQQQWSKLAFSDWMFVMLRQVQKCAEDELGGVVDMLDSEDVDTLCGVDDEDDDWDDCEYDSLTVHTATSALASLVDSRNGFDDDDDDVSLFGDDQEVVDTISTTVVVHDFLMREDPLWRLFQSLNLEQTAAFAVKQ
ncbi:hypothetical protein HK100_001523 [Physocladia obscura]|uniref:BZIP domain-containing protein n=1 Tax=Physocladia obscura TaxID=109957 RepID=A0AAD5SZN3_9FUNG|nr:hypothetical protein HK100_001523 [Physocladia obscura]